MNVAPIAHTITHVTESVITKMIEVPHSDVKQAKGSPRSTSTRDGEECIVCKSSKRSYITVPCGHYCMCMECVSNYYSKSTGVPQCPICRTPLQSIMKVFEV